MKSLWFKHYMRMYELGGWKTLLNCVEKLISHGGPRASAGRYCFNGAPYVSGSCSYAVPIELT